MPKPTFQVLLLLALLAGGWSVATAGGPSGKDLYKANCKVCHGAGAAAGEYTPMTLIQDQWERFFAKKYAATHADLTFPGGDGKKVGDVITPEVLTQVKKFAIDHAADSEQPMTCGK